MRRNASKLIFTETTTIISDFYRPFTSKSPSLEKNMVYYRLRATL